LLIPHRTLPGTSMDLSMLGLGTVKFGRNQGIKYPQPFDLPDDNSLLDLLSTAQDLGINLIDTAPAYGSSEERLGKLLEGERHRWIISTKTGEEFADGKSHFDFSAKHTIHSVERSLQRLKTDYLDLVLVHSNGYDLEVLRNTDVMQTLASLKQTGKIRAFGFSGKTAEGGIEALRQADVAMVTYNLAETAEAAVIDYASRHDKGIFIKKALSSGHLIGQTADPVTASFRQIISLGGVTSIIIGTISSTHLKSNAASMLTALRELSA
jgi:aryl-alcohol dehydrogenase-like predicted oxidoreductase